MNLIEQLPPEISSLTLPRMRKRAEFVAASSGNRVHSSRMTVQVYKRVTPKDSEAPASQVAAASQCRVLTNSFRGPRFGLTVTKKTANAVGRNRIKRRLRGLLRELQPFWPEVDADFVIIGRAELLTAPADIIAADLKRAFTAKFQHNNSHYSRGRSSHKQRGRSALGSPVTTQRNSTDHS